MKNLTLIFNHFEHEHLGKDVFLVPYYIGKVLNLNVSIAYPKTHTNKDFPKVIRGVNLVPINKKPISTKTGYSKKIIYLKYLLRNSKTIDFLMLFHFNWERTFSGILYKLINPNGFLYLKCDELVSSRQRLMFIKRPLFRLFFKKADLITTETEELKKKIFNYYLRSNASSLNLKVKLLPNLFDYDGFKDSNLTSPDLSKKENIMITVGRLGSFQKNTEMLLEAVKNLNFKNYKLVLIGSIEQNEKDFQKYINLYFKTNPHLKERILFTGKLNSKKEVWQWYHKSKIFVLTSRYESYANVLSEAAFFRNYIISTNIDGAQDIISKISSYGSIVKQDDAGNLKEKLENIINTNILQEKYTEIAWNNIDLSWETQIRKIFNNLKKD